MIKIGRFFEEHVEKMVLVAVGILCVILFVWLVVWNPNGVEYDQKTFSPAAIDNYVYEQAQPLLQKLEEQPKAPNEPEQKAKDYLAMLDSSVNIDVDLWLPQPYAASMGTTAGGVYSLPENIGKVDGVAVEHIRAVAYMPTEVVTEERTYDKAQNEPNDLDLITVEATFDIKTLHDKWHEIFVEDVEEQWADPCLARPIFAAVQLQRQELLDDGTWSKWQDVPRTSIDPHRQLFQIIEDSTDLPPGGLKVHMLQFDDTQVQIDLLQPQAYQIASAREDWLPPLLHREYLEFQRKLTLEERREAKEAERQEREQELENRRSRRSDTTRSGVAGGGGRTGRYDTSGGMDSMYGGGDARSRRGSRDRLDRSGTGRITEGSRLSTDRRGSRGRSDPLYREGDMERLGPGAPGGRITRRASINDVYDKYYDLQLTRTTDFAKLREPVTFWAHDDTVEPKGTYRYRIRLGVFNPVAGTSRSSGQDNSPENAIVLWSDFSAETEPVAIPGKVYFFAKHIREGDKTVTVQVSKLVLGHWYSHDFQVNHGEVIGDVVETEPEETKSSSRGRFTNTVTPVEEAAVPEIIDYDTGAVMVDAVLVNDWSGATSLRTRHYYDMLYSFEGVGIEHMPVSATYWASDLQTAFSDIARLERETQEAFRDFGAGGRRRRTGALGEYEGMDEYDEQMYEEMMMEQMGTGRF